MLLVLLVLLGWLVGCLVAWLVVWLFACLLVFAWLLVWLVGWCWLFETSRIICRAVSPSIFGVANFVFLQSSFRRLFPNRGPFSSFQTLSGPTGPRGVVHEDDTPSERRAASLTDKCGSPSKDSSFRTRIADRPTDRRALQWCTRPLFRPLQNFLTVAIRYRWIFSHSSTARNFIFRLSVSIRVIFQSLWAVSSKSSHWSSVPGTFVAPPKMSGVTYTLCTRSGLRQIRAHPR